MSDRSLHCGNSHFERFRLLWSWPWPDDLHIRTWPVLPWYYYYERIWLKCHKIQGTARTLYNKQDAYGVKHKTNRKIVRHSPDQSIGGKVLYWGAVGKLSVMSTRWHWTAGCSIHAKPRPEMHGRQWWDGIYTECANINFLCQGFRKLSSDRQTDRQTSYRIDRNRASSRVVI